MNLKRIIALALCALGISAFGVTNTQEALDCTDLEFTTGGDPDWTVQPKIGHTGSSSLRSGAIGDDGLTYVETTVSGAGLLEFWWKVSSEEDCDILSVSVDDGEEASISGEQGWTAVSLVISGTGDHRVRWQYAKDGSVDDGSDCAWLDAVKWTPAPEKMAMTFVLNGGTGDETGIFHPGDTYGDLPKPEKPGMDFFGWCRNADCSDLHGDDEPLPYEDTTFYAKWGWVLSRIADGLDVFNVYGDREWVCERREDGTYAAFCTIPGGSVSTCGEVRRNCGLAVDVPGSGTLSFDWYESSAVGIFSVEPRCYDEDDEEYYYGNTVEMRGIPGRWNHCEVFVIDGDEIGWTIRNLLSEDPIRVGIANVKWTPPPEKIAVSFETNGGSEVAPAEYVPGVYGYKLPVPNREGYVFGGWYRDSGLATRIGENDYLPFESQLTLYAKWNLPLSLLDHDGLSFSEVEDDMEDETVLWATWTAEEMSGGEGAYAAVCDASVSPSTTMRVAGLSGAGTLSFDLCADAAAEPRLEYGLMADDGWEVWFEYQGSYFCQIDTADAWRHFDVPIAMSGDFLAQWSSGGRIEGLTRVSVANVKWTPAPETITVKYDTNGGELMPDDVFSSGMTYGDLSIPLREGYVFLGWTDPTATDVDPMTGGLIGKADLLPFVEETHVKAIWGLSIQSFDTEAFSFYNGADLPWFVVEDAKSPSGGPVARTLVSGSYRNWELDDEFDEEYLEEGNIAKLSTCVNGFGTLTFRYRVVAPQERMTACGESYGQEFACEIDGEMVWSDVEDGASASADGGDGWLTAEITVSNGDSHDICWSLFNPFDKAGRAEICDVTWTPTLDCTDLEFTTDGSAGWIAQSDVVHIGPTALRSGAIAEDETTSVETTVSGFGTLDFWWKVSSEEGCDILSVSVDGEERQCISGAKDWMPVSLAIAGTAEHTVRWQYAKDGSVDGGSDCAWLDAVKWTPAPEKMTMTFDLNGGTGIETAGTFHPGDTYGNLPEPVKEETDFLGWCLKADCSDWHGVDEVLPFEDRTLYAKWGWALSRLSDELNVHSDGTGWLCEKDADGTFAAIFDMETRGTDDYVYSPDMVIDVTGAGTLSFDFFLANPAAFQPEVYVEVSSDCDGFSQYGTPGEWTHCELQTANAEEMRIRLEGWDGYYGLVRCKIANVKWTPAPATIAVSFVTNGGSEVDPASYVPGTYGRDLPVPEREGCVFAGWYRESGFSTRIGENDYLPFEPQLTLYARWRLPLSWLDHDEMRFSEIRSEWEESRWAAEEWPDYAGLYVAILDAQRWSTPTVLQLTGLSGPGTLVFDLCSDGNASGGIICSYGDKRKKCATGRIGEWMRYEIPISTPGDFIVQWSWSGKSVKKSVDARIVVANVKWTPAPEKMTMTFALNGGTGIETTGTYHPGDTYGDLPKPVKAETDFLGWCRSADFSDWHRDNEILPFEDLTFCAKWGWALSRIADGLDVSGDGPEWVCEKDADVNFAAFCAIEGTGSHDWLQTSELLVDVSGPGTLSFDYYIEDNGTWPSIYADVSSDSYGSSLPGAPGQWVHHEFMTGDTEGIRIYLEAYDSFNGAVRCGIANIKWTPAPEAIAVNFVSNGGGEVGPDVYAPGVCGYELPVPEREGYVFGGWYLESNLATQIGDNDYLPFEAQLTLYAKWNLPLSLLDNDELSFSEHLGDDGEYASCWAAEAISEGEGALAAVLDARKRSSAALQVAGLSGAGTLSFDLCADGYADLDLEYGTMEDDGWDAWFVPRGSQMCQVNAGETWQHFDIPIVLSADFLIHIGVAGWGMDLTRVAVANVTWTPAPETITVKYDVNGGEAMADGRFSPGATYGGLARPTHEGYAFVGWADPSVTNVNPMTGETDVRLFGRSDLLPFAEVVVVKALWGLPLEGFDTEGLAFANDGDFPWFVAEAEQGESGGPVARALAGGSFSDWAYGVERNTSRLMTQVAGCGTLTFKYRSFAPMELMTFGSFTSYSYGWQNFTCDVDGKQVWSDSTGGVSFGLDAEVGWSQGQITVHSAGEHVICWSLFNQSANAGRAEICDVVWTPAPGSMAVSFDSDGGSEIDPQTCRPGDVYGALPVPTREGWEFLGWSEGTLPGPLAAADRFVPFQDVSLVAKWGKPVSEMKDAGLGFTTEGTDQFRLTNVKTPGGNFAAEACPASDSNPIWSGFGTTTNYVNPSLNTTVTGAGYLSFRYLASAEVSEDGNPSGTLTTFRVLVDGEAVREESIVAPGEWQRVYLTLAEATPHEVRVEVGGIGVVSCYVGDFSFEVSGSQTTLEAWAGKFTNYRSWAKGDLARFAGEYEKRFAADKKDCEARILHAVCILGNLAESEDFKTYAGTFGYTLDYMRCAFTGTLKLDADTAQPNVMADRAIAVALPVLRQAVEDLEAIPADWAGTVKLSAENWPVDEDVYLDLADVLFAKASLQGGIGLLQLLGGYDLTVDWAKAREELDFDPMKAVESVDELPGVNDDAAWLGVAPVAGDGKVVREIRIVKCGERLAVLIEAEEGVSLADLVSVSVDLGSDEDGISLTSVLLDAFGKSTTVFGSIGGTPVYGDVSAACETSRDGFLLLTFDLQGLNVALASTDWKFTTGSATLLCDDGFEDAEWTYSPGQARLQKAIQEQAGFFSEVRDLTRIQNARDWTRNALTTALAADEAVRNRPDDGRLHFIEYDGCDAARVDLVRANTEKALETLDSDGISFDLAELFKVGRIAENCDFTLLPGSGNMRVYLGALFTGDLTRKLVPSTFLDEYGLLCVDCLTMRDPTFAGLFPEMTRESWAGFLKRAGSYEVSPEQAALDCTNLAFTMGGDADWVVQSDVVHTGPSALRSGAIASDKRTFVETTVAGPGTLEFWWKVSSAPDCDVLSVSIDGVVRQCISGEEGWEAVSIEIFDAEEHRVRWAYEKDGGDRTSCGSDCAWLDAVKWTPAPETITVRYDTNGGEPEADGKFKPCDAYGKLPVPERAGWDFLGWCEGTLPGRLVATGDIVPFHDVNLVAKWGKPVSEMKYDKFAAFTAAGTDPFRLTNVKTPDGNLAAEARPSASAGYVNPSLSTTVTGAGYLSFRYLADTAASALGGALTTFRVLVDGKAVREESFVEPGEWRKVGLVLEGKKTHKVSIEVGGMGEVSCFVGDFTFEATSSLEGLEAWADKVTNYKVWTKGDLARFAGEYEKRIAADAADYEARIFHAVSILATLAENKDFQTYAKTFGYTLDYAHCAFTGTLKLDSKTAQVNAMADKAIAVAQPVMQKAIEDLAGIPDDWTDTVKLSAENWPVDEDVYLDLADVLFAKASLQGGIGLLQLLGGYDLTVDWAKAKAERAYDPTKAVAAVASLPGVNDDAQWLRVTPIAGDGEVVKAVRLVKCGERLAVLMEAPEGCTFDGLVSTTFDLRSAKGNFSIFAPLRGDEPSIVSGMIGDAPVGGEVIAMCDTSREGVLLLTFDLQGRNVTLASTDWKFDEGHATVSDGGQVWSDVKWQYSPVPARWQKALQEQTKFFSKVRNQSLLDSARGSVIDALKTALAADKVAGNRTDGLLHLVEYDDSDAERVDLARTNTEKALAALETDSQEDFDLAEFFKGKRIAEVCDFTFLPGRIYLGALFAGRITRADMPFTYLNEYGLLCVDCSTIGVDEDLTLGGLFPEMTTVDRWAGFLKQDISGSHPEQGALFVQGEKVSWSCPRLIGYKAVKLPKGWKWDSTKGLLTGTASKDGFTVDFASGGHTETVDFKIDKLPELKVRADDEYGEGVIVVGGGGAYKANAAVKARAEVASGFAFVGWFNGKDELVSKDKVYSFKMPVVDVELTARVIALAVDELAFSMCVGEIALAKGELVDSGAGAYFAVSNGSAYTMSASGLPAGIALSKIAESSYVLTGAPRKVGVYYATLTAKNNGGFSVSRVIRFVIGEAKETLADTANINFSRFDEEADPSSGNEFWFQTDVPCHGSGSYAKSVKVTGLPSGYAYGFRSSNANGAPGKLEISGRAKKAGVYTVTVKVTYANKKTAKTVKKIVIRDSGCVYIPAAVASGCEGFGTVSGGGVKAYGSTVKLTAKSKNKTRYVFAGWYLDPEGRQRAVDWTEAGEWRSSTLSFVASTDRDYGNGAYARFVGKGDDTIRFTDEEYELQVPAANALTVAVDSPSLPTVKASGVPAGFKFSGMTLKLTDYSKVKPGVHTVKLTATNVSGKKATATIVVRVPNLKNVTHLYGLNTNNGMVGEEDNGYVFDAGVPYDRDFYGLLGISVEEGWTLKVTGLPSGWKLSGRKLTGVTAVTGPVTVTFTLTKRGEPTEKATATFNMRPLPDYVVGTFVGSVNRITKTAEGEVVKSEPGVLTVTVASGGKVSGNYNIRGSKVTLSGKIVFGSVEEACYDAEMTAKVGGKTKKFCFSVIRDEETGKADVMFSGELSGTQFVEGERISKSALPKFAAAVTANIACTVVDGNAIQEGTLSLKFAKSGAVTSVWKVGGKSASASAMALELAVVDDFTCACTLLIGIPPNTKAKTVGVYGYVRCALTVDEDGMVTAVRPEQEFLPYGSFSEKE